MTDPDGEGSTAAAHDIVMPAQLRAALSRDWEPAPAMPHPARPDSAPAAAHRRARLSVQFPGVLIVVAAGALRPRANDSHYPFRASSAFTWLTGETVEGAVLVMTPTPSGHDCALYVREYAPAGDIGYFASRSHGAVWVGNVPSSADTEATLGISTRSLAQLSRDLDKWADHDAATLPGHEPDVDRLLPRAEGQRLGEVIDELRLVKDDWEIARLQDACAATARGFIDVARELPAVLARPDLRGERWLEGTFWRRARLEGNEVGYTSIVGAGDHATTLHWWRNHGSVLDGQLLLADMGIETDELYTADITRTMPVNGVWTAPQRRVYSAVLEAQTAGINEVKAGGDFLGAHRAAMWVLADHLHSWGLIDVGAEIACGDDLERPGAGAHRRYTLHSTSHMLGIDVHDCEMARDQTYRDGPLGAGNVLTVEPGLYFQRNDRSVPTELRGIGVRIEDDILVTNGDAVNLSAALPRDPDELTAWMRDAQGSPACP